MNKFVKAIKELDIEAVKEIVRKEPKWLSWAEPTGKNGLHYLGGVVVGDDEEKIAASMELVKFLMAGGMDINSLHRIPEANCGEFPATPLWYAYTKGRNEQLYKFFLKKGAANPDSCMWAIAWYDDVAAGKLFVKHGATLEGKDALFVGSVGWKRYKFAEWLLDQGADVNTLGPDGLTALMIVVKRKDEDAIRMLLKRGADPDKQNKEGLSARRIGEEKGPKRIATLLNN